MRGHFKFFAMPLYKKIIKIISDAKQDGEGVPDMKNTSIDYIIGRGKCICGTSLDRNQGAVDNLLAEQKLLPPEHIGTTIRNFKLKCEECEKDSQDYAVTIENDFKDIRRTANLISQKKSRLKQVSEEIQGERDIGKIERERVEQKNQLERIESNLRGNAELTGSIDNEIRNLEKRIDGLVESTAKNEKTKAAIAYAEEIYDWFKESYDKYETEVKKGLSESVSRLFEQMFHGKRVVEVSDEYRIILKIDEGNGVHILDTSMGEETVKNFSFVAGLIDLARKKAREELGEESEKIFSTEPYPLIMDAAFSETDDEHIANISKILPQIAEQVVFIIMRKDWAYAKPVLENHVGMVYEIKKETQTIATIKGGSNV